MVAEIFPYVEWIAASFTILATVLSIFLIYKHSNNYKRPQLQRYIIRILLMVPIYAIDSFLSLLFKEYALFFDLIRDCYESYVLYQFFTLLENFLLALNETESLGKLLEKKPKLKQPFPICFFPPIKLGDVFLACTKLGILQFTLIKPLIACISIVLEIFNHYGEGNFSPQYGYVYLVAIDNISITLSMYFLVLFYQAMKEELAPFKPVPKFLCIKAIIFFSFWQGVAIAVISWIGWIQPRGSWTQLEISDGIQNFLICVEMSLVAIAHYYAFDYEEFKIHDRKHFLKSVLSGELSHAVKPITKSLLDTVDPRHDIEITRQTFQMTKEDLLPLLRGDLQETELP